MRQSETVNAGKAAIPACKKQRCAVRVQRMIHDKKAARSDDGNEIAQLIQIGNDRAAWMKK